MTVKQCYEVFGGNYDECLSRLRTDERIAKFLGKVASDGSFKLLEDSLASHNMEEAFRAAHTLKGVCLNLSVTKLYKSSSSMCEALRGRTEYSNDLAPLFEQVKQDHELTVNAILQLDAFPVQ